MNNIINNNNNINQNSIIREKDNNNNLSIEKCDNKKNNNLNNKNLNNKNLNNNFHLNIDDNKITKKLIENKEMQDNIFKKLNFKYNPYNGKILEKYNIQLDNNDNNSLNNNNIKDKNNKDENYKREFKYYYYKDSLDKIYKYTINRFYNLKKYIILVQILKVTV